MAHVDAIEQLAPLSIDRDSHCRAEVWIDAVGPREAEGGMSALFGGRARCGEHAPEELSVVTNLHPSAALERVHANAEVLYDFKVRTRVGDARTRARCSV